MNTQTELQRALAEDTPTRGEILASHIVIAIVQRRRFLLTVTGIGLLAAIGISLLLPNNYTATAQLMPPDLQSLSSPSMLAALGGAGSIASGLGGGGGLMNSRTPGQTAIGILSSRSALDDLVNRFDLRKIYHSKYYVDARKTLAARTKMDEDKRAGILTISVTDRDRYRARDLTQAYIEELNKLLIAGNTSAAHLERTFLEERLKSLKSDLDATSNKLSQFSSRNATLNPQSQGVAMIEAAGRLQGELITAQSELYALRAQYSGDNVRVRAAEARIEELKSQLRKMGGIGEKDDGADLKPDQLYPSLRELPILGATYADLYRQMVMQEAIYETLTRQYELSRVQEAKEIPTIKVLDKPELPEKKSSPHRSIIVIIATMFSAFFALSWVIVSKLWEVTDDSHPFKSTGLAVMRSIRNRNATARN